jgi:UDP-N-acetylmuramoyl-tripeptide--D-alanyl-D-alanine ligase
VRSADIGQTVPFVAVRFRASELAAMTGGVLVGEDRVLDGLSFDSRELSAGQLFVALEGQRDGHTFIGAALAAGAAGVLVSDDRPVPVPAVVVPDTLTALCALARQLRADVLAEAEVVGITGSVGKTSTKDLVVGALGSRRRVVASPRSFNNEQGLPWTVVNAPSDCEVLVLEMGMRGAGQIGELCRIAGPTIGVVTAVGHAHTELLGGLEGVALAKGELIEALPAHGTAILNGDDDRVRSMGARTDARTIVYGSGGEVRLRRIDLDERSRASILVDSPWGAVRTTLTLPGRHMADNALAAIAVAGVVHGDIEGVADGLRAVEGSDHRMRILVTDTGLTVVDDCYNANPTSMAAAVTALIGMRARRRIAILGPMAEVAGAVGHHRDVARLLADAGVALIAVGTDLYGVEPSEDAVGALRARIDDVDEADVVVLVKGSRVARLESIVAAIAPHGSAPGR